MYITHISYIQICVFTDIYAIHVCKLRNNSLAVVDFQKFRPFRQELLGFDLFQDLQQVPHAHGPRFTMAGSSGLTGQMWGTVA